MWFWSFYPYLDEYLLDRVRAGCSQIVLLAAGLDARAFRLALAPGTTVYSVNHRYHDADRPYQEQGYEFGTVVIEDDVWVGARSVILAGVRLARGTVVAAGAVVTKDTEPYSVVAGVPARPIGRRVSQQGRVA